MNKIWNNTAKRWERMDSYITPLQDQDYKKARSGKYRIFSYYVIDKLTSEDVREFT